MRTALAALVTLAALAPAARAAPRGKKPAKPAPVAKPDDARPAPPAPPPEPVDPKVARADELFAEGKALMASNLVQACDKFDQSLRENPAALGTLLSVALCDEKLGKVASAVAHFREARDRAQEQGLVEHERAAAAHIATLTPEVPHLTIELAEPLPDASVVLDDRVVPRDQLAAIAVDPGERVIVVSAPQRLPYRTKLVIAASEKTRVVVPALARSIVVTSSRRRIGQITTVAGAAAIATGVGLGIYARHLFHSQYPDHCTEVDGGDRCDAAGLRDTDRARSFGTVGTVVGLTGVVVAGVGAYLWLRAPSSTEHPPVALVPALGADQVGVAALGRF